MLFDFLQKNFYKGAWKIFVMWLKHKTLLAQGSWLGFDYFLIKSVCSALIVEKPVFIY